MRFFIVVSCLFIFSCSSSHSNTQFSLSMDSLLKELDSLNIVIKKQEDSAEIKNKINFFELDSSWETIEQNEDTNSIIIIILDDIKIYKGQLLFRNKITREFFLINDSDITFINFQNATSIQFFKVAKESLKVIEKKKDLET